jgi:hypothetical protein
MTTATRMNVDAILSNLAAELEAMDAKAIYKGYTVADLRVVFDRVCNATDWKAPISAVCTGEGVMITIAAIEFYTATTPRVSGPTQHMKYVVESEGYRQGPAGDH